MFEGACVNIGSISLASWTEQTCSHITKNFHYLYTGDKIKSKLELVPIRHFTFNPTASARLAFLPPVTQNLFIPSVLSFVSLSLLLWKFFFLSVYFLKFYWLLSRPIEHLIFHEDFSDFSVNRCRIFLHVVEEELWIQIWKIWVWVLALPVTRCIYLASGFNLSENPFPNLIFTLKSHHENEVKI